MKLYNKSSCMIFALFFSNLMQADVYIKNKRSPEKEMLMSYTDPKSNKTMGVLIQPGQQIILSKENGLDKLKTISISSPRGLT